MRRLILASLALTLLPTMAVAAGAPASNGGTRNLSDPTYLPAKGEMDGETTLSYSQQTYDNYDSSDASTQSYTTDSFGALQSFSYGITNRIAVSLEDGYQNQSTKISSQSGNYNASGLDNPELSIRGRLIPQSNKSSVFVDLTASYSPDLFDAKQPTSSQSGTVASGNQSAGMGLIVGRRMTNWSTQLGLGAVYNGESKQKVADGSDSWTDSSFWIFATSWDNQLRFSSSRFFLNGGLGLALPQDNSRTFADGSHREISNGMVASAYLAPGYQLIPNRLDLRSEFRLTEAEDTKSTRSSGTSETIKNNQVLYVGLKLKYKIF